VCLLGVDSGYVRAPYRTLVWQRLVGDLRPRHLGEMTRMIGFDDLPDVFDSFLQGKAHGRVVVEVAGS